MAVIAVIIRVPFDHHCSFTWLAFLSETVLSILNFGITNSKQKNVSLESFFYGHFCNASILKDFFFVDVDGPHVDGGSAKKKKLSELSCACYQ